MSPTIPSPVSAQFLTLHCRFKDFKTRVARVFKTHLAGEDAISKDDLLPAVNEGLPVNDVFGSAEAHTMLERLSDDNVLMYSGDMIVSVSPLHLRQPSRC